MAWNGSGTFTRTNGANSGATTWTQDRDGAVKITASRHDTHDQDLATGINACLAKNGENAMTGNLNLGTNDITNGGDATFSGTVTTGTLSATTYSGLPTASDSVSGVVELATTAEAEAGADTSRAVTAAGVAAAIVAQAAQLETATSIWSGSSTSVTPSGMTAGLYAVVCSDGVGVVYIRDTASGDYFTLITGGYTGVYGFITRLSWSSGAFEAKRLNVTTSGIASLTITAIYRVG